MPSPKLSDANWIRWDEVVEKVRSAKTAEAAVTKLKRDIDFAFKLREGTLARERLQDYKVHHQVRTEMKRAEEMAKAMAFKDEDWNDYLDQAIRLDAALTARKKFEI
jgi:hypothetical protein